MNDFMIYIQKSVFFLVFCGCLFFGWEASLVGRENNCRIAYKRKEKRGKKGGHPGKKRQLQKKRKRKEEPHQTCWPR